MATITEDYVSFETAKLLKEKGFEGFTMFSYSNKGTTMCGHWENEIDWLPKCTLQMAMKWLRKVHGLFISISNDDLDYNWQIFDIKNRTKDLDPTCLTESYAGHRKYELAAEAAIKYCLENLI